MFKYFFSLTFAWCVVPVVASELPGFKLLRFEEDGSAYADAPESANPLMRLKYVPLDLGEEAYLSFGGEIRQRYDHFNNPDFGESPYARSDAWLQRYVLHADAHLNDRVRFFTQLFATYEEGREGGPSPVDENGAELHNAFLDLTVFEESDQSVLLRAGRQELSYGSGRLISIREGPSVRRTFTAGLARYESALWRADVFYAVPQELDTGNFDDEPNDDEALWALYATRTVASLSGSFDFYYIGLQDDVATYLDVTDEEERHSLGIRYFGARDGFDWNIEAVYQFGDFGSQDIQAWTVATVSGYTFSDLPWKPRIGLSANVASGDDDPDDNTLGSFNAIYPRGSYFSEAAILGPRNFYNLHPSVTVQPTEQLSIMVDTNFYWRLETEDGVYAPSGRLVRGPGDSNERFVGQTVSVNAAYQFTRELSLAFAYSHFFTGDFIEDTGPSEDVDFFELTLTYKF